jgi:serine/threonine-protein kinase
MLHRHALGLCASLALVTTACGGTKGSSTTSTGGSGTTSTGAGNGTTTSGTGGSGTTTSETTTSGTTTSTGALCGGPGYTITGSIFQAAEPWNTPVDSAALDPASDTMINWLASNGGWGANGELQIDLSFNLLCADATTPLMPFTLDSLPCPADCDCGHTTFPVPVGGAVEGYPTYSCDDGGDCHLIVVDVSRNLLWEMWEAFSPPGTGTTFNSGGGPMIWDLTHAYAPTLRGEGCTSADAAGYPIGAMLFSADEIKAGAIEHALRFALPNTRIRDGKVFYQPATHTGVTSGQGAPVRPDAPPYGVHFRLKSSFDMSKLTEPNAVVIAKALQKYGMLLADGGSIPLMATNDAFTKTKWADVGLDTHALFPIQVTDFEIVTLGELETAGDTCMLGTGYRVP